MMLLKYNSTNIFPTNRTNIFATTVYLPQQCIVCQVADGRLCDSTNAAMQDMGMV
jgi:hypothetical protein